MRNSITLAGRINHTRYNLRYPTLSRVISMIREGDMILYDSQCGQYTLAQAIDHIRKQPENEKRYWKTRLLPAVAYNGMFTETNSAGLVEYSSVTALDFDDIVTPAEMFHLRNRLVRTPCVLCVFVTPGGKGLKAVVAHDNADPGKHGDLYGQLLDKFNVVGRDVSCKDLARRNYLSHDPWIWTNPFPVPFHYVPSVKPQVTTVHSHDGRNVSGRSIVSIMNSVWKKKHPEYWEEGNRAGSIFRLSCLMCRWGVDESLALEYFIEGWESATMDGMEILGHVENAYKAEGGNFGTLKFEVR